MTVDFQLYIVITCPCKLDLLEHSFYIVKPRFTRVCLISALNTQALSEPEFYGDLVYKFKKIRGMTDFSD